MPGLTVEQMVLQLDADISKMEKKLDRALAKTQTSTAGMQARFDKLSGNLQGQFTDAVSSAAGQVPILGDALLSLGPQAIAAAAALGLFTFGLKKAQDAMQWADDLQATADHIGITAEALQELQFAAGEADVEVNDMQESMKNLNASLGAIQSGVGAAKIEKAFAAIDISPDQLKHMNNAHDLLPLLANRISALGTRAEQVQIARKLGIEALLPMLQDGADGLKKVTDRSHDLGKVIDNETVHSLEAMNRQVDIAHERIDTQLKLAFIDLAPVIVTASEKMADFLQFLNKKLPDGVSVAAKALAIIKDQFKFFVDPLGAAGDFSKDVGITGYIEDWKVKNNLRVEAHKKGLYGKDAEKYVADALHDIAIMKANVEAMMGAGDAVTVPLAKSKAEGGGGGRWGRRQHHGR